MNVFNKPEVANNYDDYYLSDFGEKVDIIEKRIISFVLEEVPLSHMLELGCGTGHWTEFFVNKGFQVTGLDISDYMIERAIAKNMNAEFLKADSSNIPFLDESFSIISSITMLEFVDNQDKVISEMYRVLKPGGWLILGCINACSIIGETKEKDETFKYANFFNADTLLDKLQIFGSPKLNEGVYLTSDFEIIDDTNRIEHVAPVFIAAIVQKTK